MGDSEVVRLEKHIEVLADKVSNLTNSVSSLETKVDLLIEGKIKTNGSSSNTNSTKITLAALEIGKMGLTALIAAISGYFAGKGGTP